MELPYIPVQSNPVWSQSFGAKHQEIHAKLLSPLSTHLSASLTHSLTLAYSLSRLQSHLFTLSTRIRLHSAQSCPKYKKKS